MCEKKHLKIEKRKEGETRLVAGPGVTWQAQRHWMTERERCIETDGKTDTLQTFKQQKQHQNRLAVLAYTKPRNLGGSLKICCHVYLDVMLTLKSVSVSDPLWKVVCFPEPQFMTEWGL